MLRTLGCATDRDDKATHRLMQMVRGSLALVLCDKCTLCHSTQHTHSTHTAYTQHTHSTHTALTQHTHSTHTALTPHSHRTHTAYTQHSHSTHTALTQHTHSTHTALTQHSHRTHTAYTQHTHSTHTAYTQHSQHSHRRWIATATTASTSLSSSVGSVTCSLTVRGTLWATWMCVSRNVLGIRGMSRTADTTNHRRRQSQSVCVVCVSVGSVTCSLTVRGTCGRLARALPLSQSQP